jgi:hypothetical protein
MCIPAQQHRRPWSILDKSVNLQTWESWLGIRLSNNLAGIEKYELSAKKLSKDILFSDHIHVLRSIYPLHISLLFLIKHVWRRPQSGYWVGMFLSPRCTAARRWESIPCRRARGHLWPTRCSALPFVRTGMSLLRVRSWRFLSGHRLTIPRPPMQDNRDVHLQDRQTRSCQGSPCCHWCMVWFYIPYHHWLVYQIFTGKKLVSHLWQQCWMWMILMYLYTGGYLPFYSQHGCSQCFP